MKLNDLKLYDEGIITNVIASPFIKKRFMDIGMVKGTKVKTVLLGSGIRAYLIKGTVIGIRNKDTLDIEVSL